MIGSRNIRIGARDSVLPRVQTQSVRQRLRTEDPNPSLEIVAIETAGDRLIEFPLSEVDGKGIITAEIEEALRERRIDLAAHSLEEVSAGPLAAIDDRAARLANSAERAYLVGLAARAMASGAADVLRAAVR